MTSAICSDSESDSLIASPNSFINCFKRGFTTSLPFTRNGALLPELAAHPAFFQPTFVEITLA
jgi:hypothetical protein